MSTLPRIECAGWPEAIIGLQRCSSRTHTRALLQNAGPIVWMTAARQFPLTALKHGPHAARLQSHAAQHAVSNPGADGLSVPRLLSLSRVFAIAKGFRGKAKNCFRVANAQAEEALENQVVARSVSCVRGGPCCYQRARRD